MRSLKDLTDQAVSQGLSAAVGQEAAQVATVLDYMAEFDARKLYLTAGYASMHEYCVQALHFSEEVAYKRIRVLRAIRRFPVLSKAIADGRLHLTAVGLLKHHLTRANVQELITAATHKTKSEVQRLIAERFPRLDVPTEISTIAAATSCGSQLDPDPVAGVLVAEPRSTRDAVAPEAEAAPARVEPLAPERFALQVTIAQGTYDKLRRAQELLSHALPSGDVAQVLDRALDLLVAKLEKRKFGKADRPRTRRVRAASAKPRLIPAHVWRAVAERDGWQCTFMSPAGRRCGARRFLEYDHVIEVARGGVASVENLRLRCRAHNQLAAEQSLGAAFMERKRRSAAARAVEDPVTRDLEAGLGTLGYRACEIRWALARSETSHAGTLEERMRAALALLRPRARTIPAATGCPANVPLSPAGSP